MTGRALVARCPAKVNLHLRVLGVRPDGYHELDTRFQAIDLCDTLEIAAARELSLRCSEPAVPSGDDNLVLRAARLLQLRHGRPEWGASFRLHKSIPAAGGLGGGSSDAAAALLLASRHWGLDLAPAELHELARELGADVPFFLIGGSARGRGRGDLVEALPASRIGPLLLGVPDFGIPTAEVFGRFRRRLTPLGNGVSLPSLSAHKWPQGNDFESMVNDLEAVVFEGWPELRRFRDALLEAGASGALLSGSGSTVFGVFSGEQDLGGAAGLLGPRFPHFRILPCRAVQHGVQVLNGGEGDAVS